ncbi:putative DNA-binding transcriptional regulator YafY [Allocatelliglobosispora scoriae]|uniref:Putative DNA-binding transcriptional regulator YafY n=1 Tax=Allocatelliglobosispora scoriae TaxID=643052 RepID=A0A841BN69_9ACTN|nr:YafY family protein [Allocatelliglobosispora scoriae]MBB5869714.1 putative DNA-binding transcriptional regulator YafY [Allocatelliglobosispora scoriae]
MSHPASRVLAMLELLQMHHVRTGVQLAADLGVDERTVRRYAATLAELGVPVVASRGRHGGYRLAPGYKLPPLMLTDDEAVAVALGLAAADQMGLTTAAPATSSALAKIQRVLPTALADRLAGVLDNLGFTQRRRDDPARPATDTLLGLGAAARTRHRVRLAYRSWRGEDSERDLDPYGLVFHAGHWYTVGHDHRSGEIRTFRIDRVVRVAALAEVFAVPDGFDPVGHVVRSLSRVPYAWEVEVLLATDLASARARVPPSVAELSSAGTGVLLRCRAERLDGMAPLLAGLGFSFTILRPEELRIEMIDYADRLVGWARSAAVRPDRG